MSYELWETTSRNVIGNYATEAEALAAVRESESVYGAGFTRNLALLYADESDAVRGIAKGEELAKLAHQSARGSAHGTIRA